MTAVPIGGKASVELKATRRGGFTDAIDVKFIGLPPGKLEFETRNVFLEDYFIDKGFVFFGLTPITSENS